jgi:DNA-binding MarR family transcriptional regulator
MPQLAGVDDSLALANELRPILLRLARHLRAEVHAAGVTGGQIAILVAIEFHPGMSAQALAAREGLSGPGISGHLARLEGLGLIRRTRLQDKRRVGLFLTTAGRNVIHSVRNRRTSWLSSRLELLAPEEREVIRDALAALDRVSMMGGGDR